MSVEYSSKNHRSDHDGEIDLKDLFIKIIGVLKRRFNLLVIFSIVGLILGFASYLFKTPIYSSSMTLSSTILTAANTSGIIETLQTLISEGNHEQLSKKLGLPVEQVRYIDQISVESERDVDASEDYSVYTIHVGVTNNEILVPLQSSLITFLENNQFVKRRVDARRKNLQSLIIKLQHEITEIDSLKDAVNKIATKDRPNVVIMDPVNIYIEGVNLYQKELELQSQLSLIENFQIIDGFTSFNVPSSPTKNRIIYGFLVGFFIGIISMFLVEFSEFYKNQVRYENA